MPRSTNGNPVNRLRKAVAEELFNLHGTEPFVFDIRESKVLHDTLIEAILYRNGRVRLKPIKVISAKEFFG